MILNNEQQSRFIYFLTLGLLVLIGIPLIICLTQYLDFSDTQTCIAVILILGLTFFLAHQILIKLILKVSNKNQLKQEDLKFASFLIYTKIQGIPFTLIKQSNQYENGYHLIYRPEIVKYPYIRKRALFALLAIEKTQNVVLTAELRKQLQDEWTAHLQEELAFDEAFHLWRKEIAEVSPLVVKYLKTIKKLSAILSIDPDIRLIHKLLDSLNINNK